MTKKKSKFLTFLFSLIPGAGEMFLGFYKQGASLMACFFILVGVAGYFQLEVLLFLSPILWFYSFIHTNNLNSLPDDEFYALEDNYIIRFSDMAQNKLLIKEYRSLLAVCLIFFGISILCNNLSHMVFWYLIPALNLSDSTISLLQFITQSVPQTVIAVLIIAAGVCLIKRKYQELKDDDSIIPPPPYLNDKEH